MKYKSKTFKHDNYFILYTLDDFIIRYFDNFNELSKIFNYSVSNLVWQYNRYNTDIITIEVDNKKFKLATFVD